jgi:hypothetical protein
VHPGFAPALSDQLADLQAWFAAWRMADAQPGRRIASRVYAAGRPPNEQRGCGRSTGSLHPSG